MSIESFKSVTWKCDRCGFEETFTVGTPGKDWIRVMVVVEDPLGSWDKIAWQVCSWECGAAIAENERVRFEGFDPNVPGVMWPRVMGHRHSRQGDMEESSSTSIRQ